MKFLLFPFLFLFHFILSFRTPRSNPKSLEAWDRFYHIETENQTPRSIFTFLFYLFLYGPPTYTTSLPFIYENSFLNHEIFQISKIFNPQYKNTLSQSDLLFAYSSMDRIVALLFLKVPFSSFKATTSLPSKEIDAIFQFTLSSHFFDRFGCPTTPCITFAISESLLFNHALQKYSILLKRKVYRSDKKQYSFFSWLNSAPKYRLPVSKIELWKSKR